MVHCSMFLCFCFAGMFCAINVDIPRCKALFKIQKRTVLLCRLTQGWWHNPSRQCRNSCYTLALSGISGTPGLPQVSPIIFAMFSHSVVGILCKPRWLPGGFEGHVEDFVGPNWDSSTGPNHTGNSGQKNLLLDTFWNMILIQIPRCTGRRFFVCWNSKSTWSTFKWITPSFLNSLPDNFIGLDMDKTTTPLISRKCHHDSVGEIIGRTYQPMDLPQVRAYLSQSLLASLHLQKYDT